MIQKCSFLSVLEVFFQEPTAVHFIREISRTINLAPTSIKNHIEALQKENLIIKKSAKPFDGFIANRDDEKFKHLKQAYNFYSLFELKKKIIEECYPKQLILFGSYARGEDIENSDIDILIISKTKKNLELSSTEKKLKRTVHLTFITEISKLDESLQENVKRGFTLYG